jgi:hypothetical protein
MTSTRLRAGAAGFLLTAALAACSGGAAPSGVATLQSPDTAASSAPSASPSASLDPETARLEFARCMRDHGVDVPDPGAGGGVAIAINGDSADAKKTQAAIEACQQFMGTPGDAPEVDQAMQDNMLAFSKCMREHGVDMPDPVFDGKGGVTVTAGVGDGGMDPSSKTFQAAQEACKSILGDSVQFGGTSPGGPISGPITQGNGPTKGGGPVVVPAP